MYELLVLSLLMHFPLHAYLIAKIISPWEKISRGTLSTLLSKLEQAGMIAEAGADTVPYPSDRPSRALQITELGRKRFMELMLDTGSGSASYQKLFHIKAQHLEFLSARDQLLLVEHYLQYAADGIAGLRKQIAAFRKDTAPGAGMPGAQFYATTLDLLEVRLEAKELDLAWAQRLQAAVISAAESRQEQ
ncbi:PadR family transcriptional regulator [Paenibacillus sp. MMS20-IR301]|uniref:PadR family transcriptional regulator n=1 Tax=Paenibacillus sp. MMS20-IR301 TaxID=2895946 RepID=UPI0028EA6A88|nr:PadR family transcriptional regulator [Paenibacillus sp. MMS20-IR301]WNS45475.1 PadR family transcriptional regulator [Paenibacillus sp. MMS20-IR301]